MLNIISLMFALHYFMETCFLGLDNIVNISNIIIKVAHHHFKLDFKINIFVPCYRKYRKKERKLQKYQKEHLWLYHPIHLKTNLLLGIEKSFDNFKN